MLIVQSDCYAIPEELPSHGRKPFHWVDASKPMLLAIRLIQQHADKAVMSGSMWDWTSSFPIDELGTFTLRNANLFQSRIAFVKVSRKFHQGAVFVIFHHENLMHPLYRIENHSRHVALKYAQEGQNDCCEYLDCQAQVPFAWPVQAKPHLLNFEFFYGKLNKRPICIEDTMHQFNLDILDQNYAIQLPLSIDRGHYVHISTFTDGFTKVIRFSDIPTGFEKPEADEQIKRSFHLDVEEFGISLIFQNKERRVELAYISLEKIRFLFAEYDTVIKTQLKIGDMQIDNQLYYRVMYPVIFTPKQLKEKKRISPISKSFFDIAVTMRTNVPQVYYLEVIDCLLQTMDVKLDDEILAFLLKFGDRILQELETTVNKVHEIFLPTDLESFESQHYSGVSTPRGSFKGKGAPVHRITTEIRTDWLEKDLSEDSSKIYIVNLKLSPIEILVSHCKKMSTKVDWIGQANVLERALGVALSNIDGAPIKLKAIEMSHVFGNTKDIFSKIFIFYKKQFLENAFRVFGSLDIIGNPVNLFSTLSTGVQDFFFKPMEGFVQGPLEGSRGILEGTGSLFKNTIKGTFGSTSKITSSISKGILALTNDGDYINQREERQIQERPKNVVDGIGYGIKSALRSVGSGITGIFRQPMEGAKKKGITGFFKGTAFGLAGIFVKPVSGGLDLLSKTSEGLKNTASMFDEDLEEMRTRLPRRFYTKSDIFKEYNLQDSCLMVFLENVKNGQYSEEHFIDCTIYKNDNNFYLILLNEEHIVFINIGNKTVIWEIPSSSLERVQKFSNGLKLNAKTAFGPPTTAYMEMTEPMMQDEILEKLQQIIK